ncbi:glycosyltransferase [Geitlerinema sp. PCC 9228]|uniref:glycosyltransferase n=1 Tax=Geitlerinema sp. PCC 9228 TaxID=111611 RepID=UPI0008F9CAE4|nr:glycosyltransferase [Geitlerinema sp. PCC 9228]
MNQPQIWEEPDSQIAKTPDEKTDIAVSVIIPCYNHGEFLLEAIASVETCQQPIYEILIIDDASTEELTQKTLTYLKERGYRVIEHQENAGLAAARNTGVKAAQGRYFLPLDADNRIRANYITKGAEILDTYPQVGVVHGYAELFGEKTGTWEFPEVDLSQILNGNQIDACAVIRKRVWQDCGGYDPHIPKQLGYEDWDFWLSALENQWQFYRLPEVLFDYRCRHNSMVSACNLPENRRQLVRYISQKHLRLYTAHFANVFAEAEFRYLSEQEKRREIELQLERSLKKQEDLSRQLQRSQTQLQQLRSQVEPLQAKLQQTERQWQQKLWQKEQEFAEKSQKLHQEREEIRQQYEQKLQQQEADQAQAQSQWQSQLQKTQQELSTTQWQLDRANLTITAMETSKFWQLRNAWFRLKNRLKFLFTRNPDYLKAPTVEVGMPPIPQSQPTPATTTPPDSQSQAFFEEVPYPPPLQPHTATVDIIVCVHNALADVKRCLASVIRYTSMPYHLILVDDGSKVETKTYLERFATSQNATLLRNENARGYTLAANQGLRQSSGDYALLLNSDTIVTPNWLDRMVQCAESDPTIGLVGPLSNKASWQSVPEIFDERGDWADNFLPEGMDTAEVANAIAQVSARLYPRIPFLNGFCLLIRRRLIEDIGIFDEETFAAGYGEENDYCLRTRQAGWQLAVADDAYVYHHQARSYTSDRRRRLCENADRLLASKHGQDLITFGVSQCRENRVLEGIRVRVRNLWQQRELIEKGMAKWEGKRVLFLLPISEPGGGGNLVLQAAQAMQEMGVDARIANWTHMQAGFERGYPDLPVPVVYAEGPQELGKILPKFDAVVATLYASVEWMDALDRFPNQTVKAYYILDFEPYFFSPGSAEYKRAWNSYTRYRDLVRITKTPWNRDEVKKHIGVDCALIGPSANVDLFRPRPFQQLRQENSLLRHGSAKVRIAAMIRPSTPRRNPRFTMEVLREIDRRFGGDVDIVLFGCLSEDPRFQELPHDFTWRHAGMLKRRQVAALMNEADIFVDFSKFQALGVTALEAMLCGTAVVVPRRGGSVSFVRDGENGLVVDSESHEDCVAAVSRLVGDRYLRDGLVRQAMADACQYFPQRSAYNMLEVLFDGA